MRNIWGKYKVGDRVKVVSEHNPFGDPFSDVGTIGVIDSAEQGGLTINFDGMPQVLFAESYKDCIELIEEDEDGD